jgi:hypothetical protein
VAPTGMVTTTWGRGRSQLHPTCLLPPWILLAPSPWLNDEDHRCHAATGLGHEPQLWMTHGGVWRPVYEVARSEGSIGQLASGSREGDSGHSKTLTLGLGVFVENVGGSREGPALGSPPMQRCGSRSRVNSGSHLLPLMFHLWWRRRGQHHLLLVWQGPSRSRT